MAQILGLLGQAGSGKDTIAEIVAPVHLVEIDGELVDIRERLRSRSPVRIEKNPAARALRPRAVQVALADPLKEYALKVYDFSLEQLWGPSSERNAPDKRYPRSHEGHAWGPSDDEHPDGGPCKRCGQVNPLAPSTPCVDYLTPREALQKLGTEWGRDCYPDTWVRLAMRRAQEFTKKRIERPSSAHTFANSWVIQKSELVVISDCRFVNEARMLHEGGQEVWSVARPGLVTDGAMYQHRSETEQVKAADEIAPFLTHTVQNDSTIEALRGGVETALKEAGL